MAKITVGCLVHNEAQFIEKTIESILSQSLTDIEVLVGDNASSDGSSEIIKKMASKDARIIYLKRERNLGALENWNDLVRRAKGEYFVLAGGHDEWTKTYLESLAAELDKNPDAVLTFAKTQWLDYEGNKLDKYNSIIDTSGMSKLARFVCLMFANQHYMYGMSRVSAMKITRLQKQIIGSGELFLQELGQLGSFVLVEGERWFRRENRAFENDKQRRLRYMDVLFSNRIMKFRFIFFPMAQFLFWYLMLPFTLRGPSLVQRLGIICCYPLIIFKFLGGLYKDCLWLLNFFLEKLLP